MDEATSSIDIRTEKRVQAALDRVSKNRTTIVIAHRLSTIKRADKIVVLRQGKLVEEGTHETLLTDTDGVYYGLVHAQELTMEAEQETDNSLNKINTATTEHSEAVHASVGKKADEEDGYKKQGILFSLGRLIAEQRSHWFLYSIAFIAILVAGGRSLSRPHGTKLKQF